MRLVRSGDLIYMDVEAATRLLHYVDLAYNELDNDKDQAENCLLGRMLQDVISHNVVYYEYSAITCDSHHYAACPTCTDPMRGTYPFCPLVPPEVIPDGQT